MAQCEKCEKHVVRLRANHGKWVCEKCRVGYSLQDAPNIEVFEPYVHVGGPINEKLGHLKGTDKNYVEGETKSGYDDGYYVESKAKQKWLFDSIERHRGEKGEKVMGGHELSYKPRRTNKVFSFSK